MKMLCSTCVSRLALGLCFLPLHLCLADVLLGHNGERFVGRIVEESAKTVVFESETGGRLTVPWSRIRELQRGSPEPGTNQPPVTAVPESASVSASEGAKTDAAASTNAAWQPPGVGTDGFDWIQLKSDEWLKGYLDYVKDKKVQFESDKLEDLSLDLKDVRQLYSGKPLFTKFEDRDQVYGTVAISNDLVEVFGPEQIRLSRDQLTGITPGGEREISFWSGKARIGLSLQSGNTSEKTMNASAELARRTPATQFLLNYLGNFSEINGEQSANNHRVNLSYDVRLNQRWFLRPLQLEYYRDVLANIDLRGTAGVGVGYYIFDRDKLKWRAAVGPGYQHTRFITVAPGESESASTPAGLIQTTFEADITSRLTFAQTITATLASQEAGLYSHHFVSTLEFEIKRRLDLAVSFVWDYLQDPKAEESGSVPKNSDLRLTLGIGVRF